MSHPVLRRVAMATIVTVTALAALEGVARLLPEEWTGRREIVLSNPGQGEAMVANEDVPGWDLTTPTGTVGNQPYVANHWRMRGPEYPEEKAANAQRVIFVGDSSIFGFLLDWDDTMSAQFERQREARMPGVDYQVANCAAPGHTSVQSIYKLSRQCIHFRPDVVVIGNRNSDGTYETASDRERFQLAAWSGPGRWLQNLSFYRLLRNRWLAARVAAEAGAAPEIIPQGGAPSAPKGNAKRVPPDEYEQNLRELIEISREGGAYPVLLLLPVIQDIPWMGNTGPRDNEYDQAMRRVAQEEGVPLADGPQRFAQLPRMPDLFIDPVHPGRRGAWVLADLLDQTIPDPIVVVR